MTTLTEPPTEAELPTTDRLLGESSMWVFVLGDLVIFGVYFLIFMVQRAQEPGLFLASQQHLSQDVGVANTLVLLLSSWLMARAVVTVRAGQHRRATKLVAGTGACGVVFLVVKAFEWSSEVDAGHTFASNDFFAFYFVLTGVHLLHVVMGLIVLGVVLRDLREPTLQRLSVVETGAVFWHMVDLLWLVVFALVYLMR